MKKLLIVDDDLPVLAIMQRVLEETGFSVATAGDGNNAMEKLRTDHFDMMITDILLPHVDGLVLIDVAFASNPDIIVLAISGGGQGQDGTDLLDAALESGADAILEKPFLPGDLVRTVRALLR